MRILLTGATGFVGRHLLPRLPQNTEIYALVRRLPAALPDSVHYIRQDLRHPLDRKQLPDQLDAIIHQAALIDTADMDERIPFAVNVTATWQLLRYAASAGVQTFVHASTGGVYGCRNLPFVESDPFNPMDFYSLTKAQAELAVQPAPGDFRKIVLRYFFPYGVGTPNPIPSYVERALQNKPIEVLESGKPFLNPLHVNDAVEATLRALGLEGSAVINIAGTQITSFAHIAESAALRVGHKPRFIPIPDVAANPYYRANLVADIGQMRSTLGFMPSTTLEEGIGELVHHYQAEGQFEEQIQDQLQDQPQNQSQSQPPNQSSNINE